jgi:GT2 family glycosyltransferase
MEKINADYVVLLNPDTIVIDPNWVNYLLEAITRNPKVVAVTCKMVSWSDHSILDSVGAMGIPFWRGFVDIVENNTITGNTIPRNLSRFLSAEGHP